MLHSLDWRNDSRFGTQSNRDPVQVGCPAYPQWVDVPFEHCGGRTRSVKVRTVLDAQESGFDSPVFTSLQRVYARE